MSRFISNKNAMHPQKNVTVFGICITSMAVVFIAGCGAPEAVFSYRDSTQALIPDAQKAVKQTLVDGFGTPHKLVAWDKFPVAYGGAKAIVAGIGEGASKDLTVTVDEGGDQEISAGDVVTWLTGARSKSFEDVVEEYDPVSKKLTWRGRGDGKPVAGDKLVIGFGDRLRHGRALYMRNCMHCHGVAGDGNGSTAQYLNPKPRDYRLGVLKFTSTLSAEKANRDDIHRIVKYGIPGTYMPSFLLLGDQETADIVEYVRWLAVRGEFEKRVTDTLADYSIVAIEDGVKKASQAYETAKKAGEKPDRPATLASAKKAASEAFQTFLKQDYETEVEDAATFLADAWTRAEEVENVISPTVARVRDDAASRERGRLLYLSDKTKCYTCHGMIGKGDGAATEDFWKKPGSDEFYPNRGLHDTWGNQLQPRNLTLGQYRGGRRPVDVFRRIYAGIKGTPMPGFGKTALKDEEIWDVVNYVMSLQYQGNSRSTPNRVDGHASSVTSTAK